MLQGQLERTLDDSGCWDRKQQDLVRDRYVIRAKGARSGAHKAKAAHDRRVVHAAHALSLVHGLRKNRGKWDPDRVCVAAMLLGEILATLNLERAAVAGTGSRRVQREDEAVKDDLSSLLFLLVRAAVRSGDLEGSLVLAYEGALPPEDSDSETAATGAQEQLRWVPYRPRSNQAFYRRLSDWRRAGLID